MHFLRSVLSYLNTSFSSCSDLCGIQFSILSLFNIFMPLCVNYISWEWHTAGPLKKSNLMISFNGRVSSVYIFYDIFGLVSTIVLFYFYFLPPPFLCFVFLFSGLFFSFEICLFAFLFSFFLCTVWNLHILFFFLFFLWLSLNFYHACETYKV